MTGQRTPWTKQWPLRGLLSGVRTERPEALEQTPAGAAYGLPVVARPLGAGESQRLGDRCPTGALEARGETLDVHPELCIRCGRCVEGTNPAITMRVPVTGAVHWHAEPHPLPGAMRSSVHIRVVHAGGDCGACLNEVRQLTNPVYSIHRFGFFITPTPRHADVLLVVGSVTEHMRSAVEEVYGAMPEPKRVIAAGHCALTGGLWHSTLTGGVPVNEVMPVDVDVLGAPPGPQLVLEGLLLLSRRTTTPGGTAPAP